MSEDHSQDYLGQARVSLTLSLTPEDKAEFRRGASEANLSVTQFLIRCVRAYSARMVVCQEKGGRK